MRNIWILFKREMMAYFFSPMAYVVGFAVLIITGFYFKMIIDILSQEPGPYTPMDWFFNGIFSWILILVIIPVITMRLFAEEKKTGTLEGMMTVPIRDTEYVLGKFLSAFGFFVLIWAPTFSYVFILRNFAKDTTPLDMGPIFGGYIGFFLVGMLLIAIGCFASSLTRNQIIAAIICFVACATLFFTGIYFYIQSTGPGRNFFDYISMLAHMQEMARGILDWRRVAFYLSGTLFFLFLTHRVVQSRQWKS